MQLQTHELDIRVPGRTLCSRITSYNVCYTKLLRLADAALIEGYCTGVGCPQASQGV